MGPETETDQRFGAPASSELLTSEQQLTEVEDTWRELAVSTGNAFVTPEWFSAWMTVYGKDARPEVPVVRDQKGQIVGLLPMVRTGSSRIAFAGANVGDRFAPVARPSQAEAVAELAGSALAQGRAGIELHQAAEGSWLDAFAHGIGKSRVSTEVRDQTLPLIDLYGNSDWEGYLASMSRNLRSQIRRKTRSLERDHGARFRLTEDPADLEADLASLFTLHDARWSERGGSASSTDASRRFHAEFCSRALSRGWLRLWTLELDGRPAAAWYGWKVGPVYSYYLAGFDPEFSRQSAGFVLLAHTIRAAIEEGADVYDLLLGDEGYKDRFATRSEKARTIVVAPRLSSARIVAACEATGSRAARSLPPAIGTRLRAARKKVRLPHSSTQSR